MRLLASLLLVPCLAFAHGYESPTLKIAHPYALVTPPGATTGGAYLLRVENLTSETETLLGATTPAADRVEIHDMKMDGDVMRMRAVSSLVVEPGKPVTMAPRGGYHLMLVGLHKPLVVGDEVPLTLQFAHAGRIEVMLHVQERAAAAAAAPGMAEMTH